MIPTKLNDFEKDIIVSLEPLRAFELGVAARFN